MRLTPATLTVAMFGIFSAIVGGYFVKNLFAQKEKPAVSMLREVPMAITDIKPGTIITADHLGMGRYDRTKLSPDVLLVNRVIVGRVAREEIKAAIPIKAGQLYQPGELPPLDVGPGMRAVSVEVGDGVAVVDGMIKPGDNVDVLFTSQGIGGTGDSTFQGGLTMRLFEAVKVLAINRNFAQGRVDKGNNHVTLELTVAQTNIVVLAKERGKITLTYNPHGKGNGGLALSNEERVTLYELLGLQKADPAKPPFSTEIYKGNSRARNLFDETGRHIDSSNPGPATNNAGQQKYQLPDQPPALNMNVPSNGRTSAQAAPANNSSMPQLNAVPSGAVNQTMIPKLERGARSAPTAHLVPSRN